MSKVKSKNTLLEMRIRKLIYSMGYRYRLHDKNLPGSPDIVFRIRRKVIFVHGCFWHGHENCSRAKLPTTRQEFWKSKISKNVERDKNQISALKASGWRVLTIWQCQTKNTECLIQSLNEFLESP